MIRSTRGLIFLGLIVFVIGIVVLFPARVAIGWFAPSGVSISGVQGSVWRGRAEEASVDGFYLRDLNWTASPLALFYGKFAYQLAASPISGFFDSHVSADLEGNVTMTNLTAALPLGIFADAAGIPNLDGNASAKFERLEIVDGLAIVADGTIQIANLIVPFLGRESLGAYSAEFRTQNNGIVALIEDADGIVDLAGSLQVRTDRSFKFLGQVIVTAKTPQSVRQQLKFLPPANERGQQEIRLEGVL